ncbi:hypothetical protein [Alcaligenes nematophilus]|uniref:hypothetical protein n=1 Tax=Alcaligenes nematophilus TaxID=2994643 RepID=UPI003850CCB8
MIQLSWAALPPNSALMADSTTAGPVKHKGINKAVKQADNNCSRRMAGDEKEESMVLIDC